LAYVNVVLVGAGAKVWNPWALWAGLIAAALIIPIFAFRHFIQDRGQFPEHMLNDLSLHIDYSKTRKAGVLPFVALGVGLALMLWANWYFVLPS
jgi:hypothetical protein